MRNIAFLFGGVLLFLAFLFGTSSVGLASGLIDSESIQSSIMLADSGKGSGGHERRLKVETEDDDLEHDKLFRDEDFDTHREKHLQDKDAEGRFEQRFKDEDVEVRKELKVD